MSSYRSSTASSSSIALEQSHADLTLLSSNLLKSRTTTEKTTNLLGDLDRRLAKLEKSLLPIHKQTNKLTRINKNLEATLRSIDGLLGHHDLVDRESPLISRGYRPDPDDLKPYMASMDRLTAATEALRRTDSQGEATTIAKMTNLLEAGARQLVQVFTRWLRDTSPAADAGALFDQGRSFPPLSAYFLEHALPLIAYLRALPGIGPKVSKDVESAYADVRSGVMDNSLRSCSREVLLDITPRYNLGTFLDVFLSLAKSEYVLIGSVFPSLVLASRKEIYGAILPSPLGLLYSTGQQLNALLKKSLHSLLSVAFTSYTELQERGPEFEEWVRVKGGRKDNELSELTHAIRGTCLTSLPEFIDNTTAWGSKSSTSPESSDGVSGMTVNVVTFMRQLSDQQSLVESFLSVLGDGNWGGPSHRGQNDDGTPLITRYLNDVLSILLTSLETRSRNLRPTRPGVPAIYLLNNISYIRREVLSSAIGDLLGEVSEDTLNKKMRTMKANYLDIWSPLVSSLLDGGVEHSGAVGTLKAGIGAVKGGVEKREIKDRFVRFNDAFEEVELVHGVARLDEGEIELRERLKSEVEKMIVPTYSKFLARQRAGEFSKYIKLDSEELTVRLAALFS